MSNQKIIEELREHVREIDRHVEVLEDAREFTLKRIDDLEKQEN